MLWARILVQVTINRRLLIGRDGHLDQSEAYDLSQLVREYGSWQAQACVYHTRAVCLTCSDIDEIDQRVVAMTTPVHGRGDVIVFSCVTHGRASAVTASPANTRR